MEKILVSACLYGEHVRYDDGDVPCLDERFLAWKNEGRFVSFCPEVFGGLPTPRPDSQRIGDKVISCTGADVTKEYVAGAEEALRLAKEHSVAFAIMKADSPSCGNQFIFDGTFTGQMKEGVGLAVEYLTNEGFLVFNEQELDQAERILKNLENK